MAYAGGRFGATAGSAPTRVRRSRLAGGYVLAVPGSLVLAAALHQGLRNDSLPLETMAMMALVVAVALVGGLAPAVVGAVSAGLALNLFFIPPYGTLAVADPGNAVAVVVFLVTGVAVASVVDRAARTTGLARRARVEADTLAGLSRGLVRAGSSRQEILVQACEALVLSGAALVRTDPDGSAVVVAAHGQVVLDPSDPAVTAGVAVASDVVLVLQGRDLGSADQVLVAGYTAHLTVLLEREAAARQSVHAAQLSEASRTRTALLAAVSHDLRSPLSSVKAAVSSLRSTEVAWTPPQQAELLASIEDGADRLENLIANLLDLSRLQLGAVNPLLAEVDLGEAVGWALAATPGADVVSTAVDDDRPQALVDPGLFERVLANLVENALRHTPAGTPVHVQVTRPVTDHRSRAQVRVVDHGRGVPSDLRAELFTPFQRLGDVPAGEGLGLGLAVARGLSEVMGGTLSAETTPGGGLTVVLDLPLAAVTDAQGPRR